MNAERLLALYDRVADAPDAIGRLRRFVLELAVRGKLVPQDPSDEPASEELKRISVDRASVMKPGFIGNTTRSPIGDDDSMWFELPPGWMWSRLGEICRKIQYGFTAPAISSTDTVRMLRITDIQNNEVKWNSVPGCEIDAGVISKYRLEPGDILVARTGGTIGKSFLITDLPVASVFASYLIRVQVCRGDYARYLKLFFESPIYWRQLTEGTRGAGQPNVNGRTLKEMLVPIPPLPEQRRIVAKVDELMAFCDRIQTAIAVADGARSRLLESLLHEALGSVALGAATAGRFEE